MTLNECMYALYFALGMVCAWAVVKGLSND